MLSCCAFPRQLTSFMKSTKVVYIILLESLSGSFKIKFTVRKATSSISTVIVITMSRLWECVKYSFKGI